MESPWAPLRRRVFFTLWLAQLGSNVGSWMQTVGAQWFLVEADASPTIVALVQTANLAPALLLSLMAGVLADSFNRRRLIMGANLFAAVAATALTAATVLGLLEPVSLLAATFLIGAGVAISAPAWQAIQPDLVPRAEIPAASALGGVTVNAARAIGPAIAGVLVAWTGPALVFGLNAASFLAAAVAVFFWRSSKRESAGREHVGEALAAGIRYIRSAPVIKRILLRTALFLIPASALWALLPVAAGGHLGLGSAGYGLLLGALGVGALLGVIVLPRLREKVSHSAVIAFSALVFGVGTAAAGFLPAAAVAILLVVTGIAWIASLSTFNAVMQLTLPTWVRARGMSTYLLILSGSQALGAFAWGMVATAFGYPVALAASGVLLVLVAASILVLPLLPGTAELDRSNAGGVPQLDAGSEAPDPTAGPVLVQVTYRPAPDRVDEFRHAMAQLQLSRLRTGATEWRLVRAVDGGGAYLESYSVRTWREYERQQRDRTTGEDRKFVDTAAALSTEPPVTELFLTAS